VKLSIIGVAALISLLFSGCSKQEGAPAAPPKAAEIQSVYTALSGESCKKEPDKSDPNETPYLACPGVAGYTLIVRRVDAGRKSIDVVDAGRRAHPLKYQEVITRYMFTLDDKAEWRVAVEDGQQTPIALMVRVRAREGNKNPEKVTSSYVAVAKITPNEVCVTDKIREGEKPDAELRSIADSAQERQCAPPQPPMIRDGTVIR
jgi:hypothetical protein